MNDDSLFIPRSSIAAFASTDAVFAVLSELRQHHLLARAQYDVLRGGVAELVNHYPAGGTPQLLIVEHDGPIEDLDRVADVSAANTQIIVLSGSNDIGRYRKLLDRGGSDYLFTPISPELLLASISRTFARAENRKIGTLHTFFGCGGGVGSSTLAQNAAVLLSQVPNRRVLLVDFDVMTGSVSLGFDIAPMRGLHDLLRDPKSITAQEIARIAHERTIGLQLLCSPPAIEPGFPMKSDHFIDVLDHARTLVDHVVIDMASGWSGLHSRMFSISEHAYLVANADIRSFQILRKVGELSGKLRKSMAAPDLILNRWSPASENAISAGTFAEAARGGQLIRVGDFWTEALHAASQGQVVAELPTRTAALDELVRLVAEQAGGAIRPPVRSQKPMLARLLGRKAG